MWVGSCDIGLCPPFFLLKVSKSHIFAVFRFCSWFRFLRCAAYFSACSFFGVREAISCKNCHHNNPNCIAASLTRTFSLKLSCRKTFISVTYLFCLFHVFFCDLLRSCYVVPVSVWRLQTYYAVALLLRIASNIVVVILLSWRTNGVRETGVERTLL